jgi:FAD binding domain-containing protein/berberine-like enzyme
MSDTIAPILGEATIQEFREGIRGEVIGRADPGYAEACQVWNGAHDDRCPALIVRCAGAADVIAAVGFARSNDLAVAVRGGGHSVAGFSTVDDGLVIDLGPMHGVRVDPVARVAHVGPGAVWAEVDHETQAHALATTGGLVSTTGVAGFTLGGGIGWLMRKHGLACDNLIAADVVTADGALVRADETQNTDLLWALRGGGGNFGIVTQFEFALHPVGPIVYAGPIFYPADAAGDLLRAFRAWAPGAPDEISALVNLTSAPPLPVIPEAWHGRPVAALIAVAAGPVDDAAKHFAEFRSVAEPIADLLGPMPYTVIQSLIDPLWPKGIHSYFKATNLTRLDDDLIQTLIDRHAEVPGPQAEIHVQQMGGAVGRVPGDATAFVERSMPYVLNVVAGWHDPAAGDAHRGWARNVIAAAADASTGLAYSNFLGDPGAGRSAYGPETYARLVELKDRYDPTNLFRLNQNVEPSAAVS